MARRSLPSPVSSSELPVRLTDVDIVAESDGESPTTIEGPAVAALLDATADPERLLDPEDISLQLDHVADLLGALAGHAPPPTAGALSVAEQCLRRLAGRVEGLRPGARAHARRFVITRVVRETLRAYGVPAVRGRVAAVVAGMG